MFARTNLEPFLEEHQRQRKMQVTPDVSCCSGRREGNGFVVAMEYGKREGIGFVVTTEYGKLVVVGLVDFAVTIVYGFTS